MHAPGSDVDFDPDEPEGGGHGDGLDIDDEAGREALVWQLLLLINPGDAEAALQQFDAWRDARAGTDDDRPDPVRELKDIIDWRSGFQVHDDDVAALVESIDELARRWNLDLDWGLEDPTDADCLAGTSVGELLRVAYDALRAYGYTLWTWETGTDLVAGWITRSRDDEAMRVVAPALGIELRAAGQA